MRTYWVNRFGTQPEEAAMSLRAFDRNIGKKFFFVFSLLAVLFLNCLCVSQAYAQIAGATLSGTVMDPSGSAVPNAQIVITDVNTGVSRTVNSSSAGFYTAPNLLPGVYKLNVTAAGFGVQELTGITLRVGAEQVLDVKLQVGQVTQSLQVTGEALNVDLASSTISAQVTATTVRELPLNGRSWTDLATLQPGVNSIETQPSLCLRFGPREPRFRFTGIYLRRPPAAE